MEQFEKMTVKFENKIYVCGIYYGNMRMVSEKSAFILTKCI